VRREYLSVEQLAAITPWSEEAIRRMVSRGVLKKGVHYFQPLGARSRLVFKWSAIVQLIEGAPEAQHLAAAKNADAGGGELDVEGATAELYRLLD
jgi:hypothetical protein